MAQWVIDRAIQAHGGGVSQDFSLAHLWASARTLRFADGPDEVHKRSLSRREIRKATSSGDSGTGLAGPKPLVGENPRA